MQKDIVAEMGDLQPVKKSKVFKTPSKSKPKEDKLPKQIQSIFQTAPETDYSQVKSKYKEVSSKPVNEGTE